MKVLCVFVAWGLLLAIACGMFSIHDEYSIRGVLEEEIFSHLSSVAELKASRIGFFLDERKDDLIFLRESSEVERLLESGVLTDQIDEKLDFFYRTNEYLELLLISGDGVVLWSAKDKAEVGRDLSSGEYEDTKLGAVYGKVQNDFGVGIFDPGYYEDGERLSVFVTSPVLKDSLTVGGKKDIVGIIALRIDNAKIEERVFVGREDMNVYLVNRDGTVITSSKLSEVRSQKLDIGEEEGFVVDGEMYGDCFEGYRNYYFTRQGENVDEVKTSGRYVGNFGEDIFGAHQYILETGWCVMAEVDRGEFYGAKGISWFSWFLVLGGFVSLGFLLYYMRRGCKR